MSFTAMAPMDGKAELFGHNYEELNTDYFDEFLTFNNDIDHLDYTTITTSTYLDASTNASTSAGTSLSFNDEDVKLHFNNGGLGESPYLTPPKPQFYNDLMGRAAVSDTELLSFGSISLESPQIPGYPQRSLPSSPTPIAPPSTNRTARMVEAISKSFKKATNSIDKAILRSPIRKQASMSKLNGTYAHNSNAWSQKLEQDASKFNFNFNENSRALTPPLTCNISEVSSNLLRTPSRPNIGFANGMTPHQAANPSAYNTPHRPVNAAYNTPLPTPGLESHHSRKSSMQYASTSPLFPVTPKHQTASGPWGQLAGSPPLNNFRNPSVYSEFEEPLWWNHASSTTKMAQPQPNVFHANPQQATKSLAMQLQNEIAYNSANMAYDPASMASGLMIQLPGAHPQEMERSSPPLQQQGFFDRQTPHQQHQHQQRRVSRSQYSQAHMQCQEEQQLQSQHQQHMQNTSRKSRALSSESEPPSPKTPASSSFHVRKRRSSKNIKHATPRTPSMGGGVDFVNFTPYDSKRILTGVAPSGSSKTKARREKEALEKRRKLSQAAVRAVRAAGGDIESLVEEGLIV